MKISKLFVVLAAILGVSYFYMNGYFATMQNNQDTKEIVAMAKDQKSFSNKPIMTTEESTKESSETETEVVEENDAKSLSSISDEEMNLLNAFYSQNNEFVAYIDAGNVKLPVYQASNNTKYLSIGQNGKKNASGAIFMDTRSNDDATVLWGHHMKNGMFKFVDQMATNANNFNSMKEMTYYVYNNGQAKKYHLTAVYAVVGKDTGKFEYDFPLAENFLDKKAVTQGNFEEVSHKLVMGTCNYSHKKAHSFVVFNMVEE